MEFLEYNTDRKQLIIPEYGRHIHKMINQVNEIESRDERNKMTKAIIGVMGNLNPHLRDVPDFQHKLWDQLFIMSEFKLDVDSPFDKPQEEVLNARPERIPYPKSNQKYRFYGNNIIEMINVANDWENGEMKDSLVYTIANHMKKCFLNWNKDTVEDDVIFGHLLELSEGKLSLDSSSKPLSESQNLIKLTNKKFTKHPPKNKKPYRNFKKRNHN